MKKTKHLFLVLIAMLISGLMVAQSDIPNRPSPPRLVNDFTNTLNQREIQSLERQLVNISNTSSNQITVVFTSDLKGYEMAEFTERLGEKWGVGQKELGNGIVILVKPKTLRSKGQVHISIGYGLEGAIPDAITKRIIENEMIPYFKQNNYYQAILNSTKVLTSLAVGEYNSDAYMKKTGRKGGFATFIPFLFIIFFVLMSRGRGSRTMGGRRGSSGLWTALLLGSMMGGGGRHGGSFSDFSGGGGGFGGFGGGGFGGGGAGGSW